MYSLGTAPSCSTANESGWFFQENNRQVPGWKGCAYLFLCFHTERNSLIINNATAAAKIVSPA